MDCSNLTLSGSSGTGYLIPNLIREMSAAWIVLVFVVFIGVIIFLSKTRKRSKGK